jgi:glycosyltransferase involved in cell wall biosynthesis
VFSVVIPVYNHQEFVTSSLLSAVQSPLVTEVLVVDDGSADRSARLIEDLATLHDKIALLPGAPPGNLGAYNRLNALVRHARNHWVAVLNSDDEFVPGRFEVIERGARQGIADLFFGDLIIIDGTGERLGLRRALTSNEYPWRNLGDAIDAADHGRWTELLLQQNILATTTNMVFTKTVFERVGGFRPYRYCHDWDFALRVALSGVMKYEPLLMSRYRKHQDNTIRENRVHVEAEVRAMMLRINEEFADLTRDRVLHTAILQNRYLHPPRSTWLEIVRSVDPAFGLAETTLQTADIDARFVDCPTEGTGKSAYIYAPKEGIEALTVNDLRNIRLAAAVRRYDVYLISRTLDPFPAVGSASLQDLIVYDRAWASGNSRPVTARLMRLLPATRSPVPLRELIGDAPFAIDHAFADTPSDARSWANPLVLPDQGLGKRPTKPVVFIFPIFLAVGGAERLLIETMRHLVAKYHFVVINSDPLLPEHGSLHGEALRYAEVYDISETVRVEDRLTAIELLKRHYHPTITWITNGSSWQVAHARQLRTIFADTPIVDNQVYDHEHGWINSFSDTNVRSADRYIAINGRIKAAMIERFGIDEAHIDLVYHGAKISDLRAELPERGDVSDLRGSLGLPPDGLLFGMLGRLAPQKRPQDLVHLAARVAARGGSYHFLWAGPGEMRDEIKVLQSKLHAGNFSLLAARPDVRPLYEAIDGLIVTSEFEGLPFVVLEALAMGVPVLSTPVGAIEEILTSFESGRISGMPGDLDALESAFYKFVEDLPTIRAAARARRLEFIDKYSSERMAAEYDASWMRAVAQFRPAILTGP